MFSIQNRVYLKRMSEDFLHIRVQKADYVKSLSMFAYSHDCPILGHAIQCYSDWRLMVLASYLANLA